jgi:hypothetical protein
LIDLDMLSASNKQTLKHNYMHKRHILKWSHKQNTNKNRLETTI